MFQNIKTIFNFNEKKILIEPVMKQSLVNSVALGKG